MFELMQVRNILLPELTVDAVVLQISLELHSALLEAGLQRLPLEFGELGILQALDEVFYVARQLVWIVSGHQVVI